MPARRVLTLVIMFVAVWAAACSRQNRPQFTPFSTPAEAQATEPAAPTSTSPLPTHTATASPIPPTLTPVASPTPDHNDLTGVEQPGSRIHNSDRLSPAAQHFFPFTNLGGGTAGVIVEPAVGLDAAIEVRFAANSVPLAGTDDTFTREELLFTPEIEGDFLFAILGAGESSGDYTITLVGTPEILFQLAYRDVIHGRLPPGAYLDYFFIGSTGDTFTLALEPEVDTDSGLEIFQTFNEILSTADDRGGGEPGALTFSLPADGLFTIRVYDRGANGGRFTMTLLPG